MWVDREAWELLKDELKHQRAVNLSLGAKLDELEKHHRKQEDARAQDAREIERLAGELKLRETWGLENSTLKAENETLKRNRTLPPQMPAWARDVDWSRVEGAPQT
jgi:hypothetical protein